MQVIIVTGTPATGKTTYAKKLAAEKGYTYIDITAFVKEYGLSDGYDEEKQCEIVDEYKLQGALEAHMQKLEKENTSGVVIDGHMSQCLDNVDECIVMRCELKELERRLKDRGYSEEKIKENLEAEIMEVCKLEAEEKGFKTREVRGESNQ